MATVTSTLKMFDAMTPVLKSVTNSINLTLSAMQSMQKSMDKTFDTRTIDAARKSVQQAEAAIKQMTNELENAKNAQDNLNQSVSKGKGEVEDFARNVLQAVGAFYLLNKARDLFSDLISQGVNFHAFMQSANVAMSTMLGSVEEAQRHLEELYAFARTTPFAFPDLFVADRNLIAFGMHAENTIPVLRAIGDAAAAVGGGTQEMMQIADVFGAIQVSGRLTMQEINRLHAHGIPALKILANQANMSAEDMRKAITKGAVDANTAIAALVKGIEEGTDGIAGQTAKMGGMMAELKNTWAGAIDSLKAAWRNAGAEIVDQHFTKLIDGVHRLTEIVRGIPDKVGPIIDFLVSAVQWIADHWTWLQPIFYAVIVLLGIMTGAIIVNTLAWLGLNAALLRNPYVWVAVAIATLIAWLINLWRTNDEFAAALMRAWNWILNMGDQLKIGIAKVAQGIVNAFNTAKNYVLSIVESMVNGVIQGINWLINQLNRIPGVSIQAIGQVSFAAAAAARSQAVRQMGEAQIRGMETMARIRAMQREQQVQERLAARQAARESQKPSAPQLSPTQLQLGGALADGLKNIKDISKNIGDAAKKGVKKVGKVGSVGRIEDEVDISNEDIKLMRELAEMRAIQNFVTLTPTVNVTTGDIRNDADIDAIIRRIEDFLEREIANSAQGVYS